MTAPPEQDALFTTDEAPDPQQRAGALPFLGIDTGGYDTAVAGDGFAWLARVLPPPVPLICPRCRRAMRLPAVPLLWQCPRCDTPPEKGERT